MLQRLREACLLKMKPTTRIKAPVGTVRFQHLDHQMIYSPESDLDQYLQIINPETLSCTPTARQKTLGMDSIARISSNHLGIDGPVSNQHRIPTILVRSELQENSLDWQGLRKTRLFEMSFITAHPHIFNIEALQEVIKEVVTGPIMHLTHHAMYIGLIAPPTTRIHSHHMAMIRENKHPGNLGIHCTTITQCSTKANQCMGIRA
jgi:hypothetical protein